MVKAKNLNRLKNLSFSKSQLLLFVSVFAIIGGIILLQSKAAGSTANLWVDTNGGTCTRQVSPSAYVDAQACSSMQSAMTAAQAGDTVIIRNGTYSGQTITSGTKASAISFYAQTPSQVLLTGGLNLDGVDRIHIYGVISAGSGETRNGLDICDTNCSSFITQDILVDGFAGKAAFIRATNVVIDHGEFGAFSACNTGNSEDGFRFWDGTGGSGTPTNSVIRNSVVHDVDAGVGDSCQGTTHAGWHVDCMQNNGGDHLTIENNIFYNCPTSNIQDDPFGGAHINNVVVQNNFFGPAHCCNSVALGYQGSTLNFDCSSLEVRYNVFDGGGVNPNDCGSGNLGVKVYGNIFVTNIFACNAGLNYSYNIFHPSDGPTCGTNLKRCSPTWASVFPAWGGAQPNPHLSTSDTCATEAGDPGNYPTTDIDGDTRPQGTKPDAGADEVRPVANVWVSTTGNDTTCVRGDQTKPCASPAKAWSLAQAGDVISIADGDYMSGCQITGAKASDTRFSGAAAARFICANDTNANPSFAHHLHLNSVQHMVIEGITIGRISAEATAGAIDHNTIKNLAITCQDTAPWPLEAPGQKCSAQIQIFGNDWLFDNVTIGPGYDSGSCGGTGDANKFPVSNSLFKNVTFHDQRYQRYVALPHTSANFCNTGVDAQHTENIFMTGSNGLTFDGLLITNGSNSGYVDEQSAPSGTGPNTGALFLSSNGGSTPSNLTIRNCSVLGAGSTFSGGSTAPLLNTLIENCTLPSGAIFQCDSTNCPGGYQSLTLRNNIFGTSSGICPIAAALGSSGGNMNDHNLIIYTGSGGSADQCGSSNLVLQTGFPSVISASSGSTLTWDLHLKAGSLAIDNADPLGFAALDKDGISRPQGTGPDIGAYEFRASSGGPSIGDLNSDTRVNITDLSIMLSHYGQSVTQSQGDINSDGTCNITDLSILLSHYGT